MHGSRCLVFIVVGRRVGRFRILLLSGCCALLLSSAAASATATRPPAPQIRSQAAWDDYREQVRRGFDRERLERFFAEPSRAADVALRVAEITALGYPVVQAYRDDSVSAEERGALLRSALGRLGPVFTKVGQTLAERPDLLDMETCAELRKLQTQNVPFDDNLAYQAIVEDLRHTGPLSPGGYLAPGADHRARPLFQKFGPCVAAASLGQVYKATTWEGQDVAVKVQRSDVAKQVVLDWQCLKSVLQLTNAVLKNTADISLIADEAIAGIMRELDYHLEAANALLFLERHKEQPWITAPRFIPEYTGPEGTARVLTMEWINGRRVGQIENKKEQLRLVNMAVEACVSQLVCTGFVHVDPHEGNILLTDDGRIAFLDFGLMGHVPPFVMEGFAAGIQYVLSGDYLSVSQVMQDIEFIPKEGFQRVHGDALSGDYYFTPATKEEFATALDEIMSQQDGGKTQFGAFFIGLLKMSSSFRLNTPPYIILFVRTFLTLEGIASQYDPKFNIYEVGLPFAMRRALAPTTETAQKAFRDNLLTPANALKWETWRGFLEESGQEAESGNASAVEASESDAASEGAHAGYADALRSLLGAPEGRAVRRILADVDMPALAHLVASSEGRLIRQKGSEALVQTALDARNKLRSSLPWRARPAPQLPVLGWQQRSVAVQAKQQKRRQRALRVIVSHHAKRLRAEPSAIILFAYAGVRIILGAAGRLCLNPMRLLLTRARKWRR
mmetsp:Transcript_6288/g.14357  ORF Transcript_6288/g.14357 Transcript_6288/m.14357 type:complete len:732 (+) Transcript_6288:95-2290(+)